MVRKKKDPPHFLDTEAGFQRFVEADRMRIPSDRELKRIQDHAIRSGQLDPDLLAAGLPGSAGFYYLYIMQAEKKSETQIAKELGVEPDELKALQTDLRPVIDKHLLDYCSTFVQAHPSFNVRQLFTFLKRAIVLYSMASGGTLRKAARKKKSDKKL